MYNGGYMGKILRINLSEMAAREEALPLEVARDFIGGAGFGITYLFEELGPGTDPLGPDNKLIFAPGPFRKQGRDYCPSGQGPATHILFVCTTAAFLPGPIGARQPFL